MAASKNSYIARSQYIKDLIATAKVIEPAKAMFVAKKIMANISRYKNVEERTGVPAILIGAIHFKEASMNFNCNLMNGQKLSQRTTIVPIGFGPWLKFEDSAVDAIKYENWALKQLDLSNGWALDEALWFATCFNGWGFEAHGVPSAYTWCNTNHQRPGGYPRDGHWDPNYIIKNTGIYSVLMACKELQGYLFETHEFKVKLTAEEKGILPDELT